MATTQTRLFCLALPFAAMAQGVNAHHSLSAHYDPSRTIEVRGVVTGYQLRSPHTLLRLEVTRPDGTTEQWEVEAGSVAHMRRLGFDRDTFREGDVLSAFGFPSRFPDGTALFGARFVTEDGTELVARPPEAVGRALAAADVGFRRLDGRWLSPRPAGGSGSPGTPLPLTPEGKAAWDNYVEELSPLMRCQPAQIPAIFYAPSYIHDIRIGDREVVFYHEIFDVTRTVPLNSDPRPAEATGFYGQVRGRIEGDTLVVESSAYPESPMGIAFAASATGNGADVPSSADKTVVERYSVSGDGATLEVEYTIADPLYLTEPYTTSLQFARVSDDTPAYGWECGSEI